MNEREVVGLEKCGETRNECSLLFTVLEARNEGGKIFEVLKNLIGWNHDPQRVFSNRAICVGLITPLLLKCASHRTLRAFNLLNNFRTPFIHKFGRP